MNFMLTDLPHTYICAYIQIVWEKNVLGSIQHVLICPTGLMPRWLQKQLVKLNFLSTMLVSSPTSHFWQLLKKSTTGSVTPMWLLCWQSAKWWQDRCWNRSQVGFYFLLDIFVHPALVCEPNLSFNIALQFTALLLDNIVPWLVYLHKYYSDWMH